MIVIDMDMPKSCKECRWHGVNDYGNEYCKFMRKGFRANDFVCPIKCDIKDIRAEIEQTVDENPEYDERWSRGLHYALCIIDKHIGGVE